MSLHALAIALLLLPRLQGSEPVQTRASARWHFLDRATVPHPSPSMPAYARLLYADVVDMRELTRAFEAHYAGRDARAPLEDLERDPYAKFFNQWYRAAQDYVDDEGFVRALSTQELLRLRRASARPDSLPAPLGPVSTWSFLGPRRTVWRADDNAGQPVAPWQVNVYCIAAAPSDPSLLYCGSETGALYRSQNKGVDWVPLDNFNWGRALLSIAVHPTDPDVVFAASSTDIFKTSDGGASWSIVLTQSGLSCNSLAISPTTPTTLLAGSANGLYRSTDSGGTWTQVRPEHVDDVEFRPGDGSVAYALTRTIGANTYTFFRSTDGGASFAPSTTGWGSIYEQSGGRLCVTPADADYVYAALLTHDGSGGLPRPYILKSTDGASTWTTVAVCNGAACPLNNGQGYYDLDIVASHVDPEQVIAATTSAYRSDDGGATWTIVGGYGGPFAIHPDIQAMISIMDGGTENTWIATDGGTNFSTDFYASTANWEARVDGLDGTDFWGFAQGWNEDFAVGGRYHNGNTALHEDYPPQHALRLGGAESVTGWALHGRERFAAFDDISELILPTSIDQAPEGTFLFTKHPQNYYYGDAFSRVMVDLEDFMTVYLGEGNSFWRSRDGGASWEATHDFTGAVYHFDISRADPDRIYLTTDKGFRRSTDRGESFQGRPLPAGLTNWHSQNLRVAASSTDADVVWILNQRSSAGDATGRVFVSNDGASSWTDLTTAALAGRKWTAIAHQAGTDGGIYIASARGEAGTNPARVLYRDAGMADWVDHSAGLPPSANPIKLLPFYRDGKLRWAGNRGLWEIDFYEQDWAPMARPFVSGSTQVCLRDIVEFDSYSIAKGSATYTWDIPGADWTSDLNQREVQATFPAPGTYSASLTIQQDGQSDAASVEVTIENDCEPEALPGNALSSSGAAADYAATSKALGVTTNTMTISAWIKRDGPQVPYAGIVFMRTATASGLNFRENNRLGFHWNNSQWSWNSGLLVPNGEWAHVAMVVSPTETVLYLNGRPAINTADPAPSTFDGVMNFGADPPWSDRRFRGEMDEVAIYDRALSQDEVRALMHLTLDPRNDPALLGYWQFNRAQGVVTDRVGTNHASLLGGATRVPSDAPVGPGASAKASVSGGGSYTFAGTGLSLSFAAGASSYPNGDLWATRIERRPDRVPPAPASDAYWVVHNFGSNATFGVLDALAFELDLNPFQASRPAKIELHRRASTAHGSWGSPVDQADSATAGSPGEVSFSTGNGQTSLGQYVLTIEPPVRTDTTGTGGGTPGTLAERP